MYNKKVSNKIEKVYYKTTKEYVMEQIWQDEEKPVKLTSQENYHKKVDCLKVKADPQDVTPEERKSNAKRLAGAISHS